MTPDGASFSERVGFWPIAPAPAPRQTSSDRWRTGRRARPRVARYHAFRDECRWRKVWQPAPGDLLVFLMPIPKSRMRKLADGMPHLQTPDIDNLVKGLLDAVYEDDAAVWAIQAAKVWHSRPGILICRAPPPAIDLQSVFSRLKENPCHATASH